MTTLSLTRWHPMLPGLWSGWAGDAYRGSVETFGARYRARDSRDSWLGDYPTLGLASRVIERTPAIG
jgi:hypothetical protein